MRVGNRFRQPWRGRARTWRTARQRGGGNGNGVLAGQDARLERELLVGLDHLQLHLLHLGSEDDLGGCGGVDTVGLDRDDNVAVVLQEVVRVEADNTRLIRLGDIGKAVRMAKSMRTGIPDDGAEGRT